MVKLCVDCEHKAENNDDVPICKHPYSTKTCVITGNILYYPCKEERANKLDSYCRSDGKGFKKKEVQGSYDGEI